MKIIINKINYIKGKFSIEYIGSQIILGLVDEEIKKLKIIINGEITKNIHDHCYYFDKPGIYIVYYISDDIIYDMSFMFYFYVKNNVG